MPEYNSANQETNSLSMDFAELKAQVAFHLYGGTLDVTPDYSGATPPVSLNTGTTFHLLDSGEKEVVKSVVRSGLRQFYNPAPIRQRKAHKWTFLDKTDNLILNAPITAGTVTYDHTGGASERLLTLSTTLSGTAISDTPTASEFLVEINGVSYPISTYVDATHLNLDTSDNPGADVAAGTAYRLHQDDYTLPDDFGRLISPLTYVEKENAWYSVEIVGEGRIRELRQRDYVGTNGSKPQIASIRTVNNSIESGTRREIMFWPAVSGAFVLKMQYRVRPQDDLNDDDIPYGGTDHAETILYSCLAESERRLDETSGVYYERYIESLASSIDLDSRMSGAHTLGYNSDRSDVGSAMGREYLFGSRIRHKNTSGTFTD